MKWEIKRLVNTGPLGIPQNITVAEAYDLEYHGEWMGDEYVTVNVRSAEPVEFQLWDRLEYRGEIFFIFDDPNVVKKSRKYTYGEGFTYDGMKLYAISRELKTIDFKDVVLGGDDAGEAYTQMSEFQFFSASIEDLADRLQENLNRNGYSWRVFTPSESRTNARIYTGSWDEYDWENAQEGETDVNVSVTSDQRCWDVLNLSYSQFGLSYFIKGYDIVIGSSPIREEHIFRYGKGQGLYEIERTSDEGQELVTKAWGYGSSTNLPLNYYANNGKRAKFTIAEKSVTEYIVSHPTYSLWVNEEWTRELSDAFRYGQVTLTHGQDSAIFNVSGSTPDFDDPLQVFDHNKKYLHFYWIDYGEQAELALYTNIEAGDDVYVDGADINKMPDEFIYIPQDYDYPSLLSINKLMLPGFPLMTLDAWLNGVKDGLITGTKAGGLSAADAADLLGRYDFSDEKKRDPYVVSKNAAKIGNLEGVVNFDGSSQTEIYPSLEITDDNEVAGAETITDDGYLDNDPSDFKIYMYRGGNHVNWEMLMSTHLKDETVNIEMTSGFCTGRKFKVNSAKSGSVEIGGVNTDVWILTCDREQDSSLNRYFPYYDSSSINGYCQVLPGNTYVATGLQIPDEYIIAASVKLLIATCGWLDKRDHVRYTYVPKVDEIFMARQHDEALASSSSDEIISLHDTLKAGMQLQFEDAADLGINRIGAAAPYIDQLTIKEEGNNGIPTYDVVLRDEKEKGALEKLQEEVSKLKETPVAEPTERGTKAISYVDRGIWESGADYYCNAINPETGYLETSQVYSYGLHWECLTTGTQERPGYGCQDWKLLDEVTPLLRIELAGNGTIAPSESDNIHLTVHLGEQDLSSLITNYSVDRDDHDPTFAQKYSDVARTFALLYDDCFERTHTVGPGTVTLLTDSATFYVTATNGSDLTVTGSFKEARADRSFVDCGEWQNNKDYTQMFSDPGDLSARLTPCVWHNGVKWKALQSQPVNGVYYEPKWNSPYWELIEGNTNLSIEFVSSRGYSFRRGAVETTITPYIYYGNIDITADVLDDPSVQQTLGEVIAWTRTSEHPTQDSEARDETWDSQHEGLKELDMTNTDMDVTWSSANKQIFTCTVTVNDGKQTIVAQNQVVA